MNLKDESIIRRWSEALEDRVSISLTLTGDSRSEGFKTYAETLTRCAPKLEIAITRVDADAPPAWEIDDNIRCLALPEQNELGPFLANIAPDKLNSENALDSHIRRHLDPIRIPASLDLYIANACPHCPDAVTQLSRMARTTGPIRLSIIDAALFSDLADTETIRSVPTVVLNSQYRWAGTLPIEEMARIMAHQNPDQLGAESLENMVSSGDAAAIARIMLDTGRPIPALVDLLIHEKWPIRLGAMVAVETVVEENQPLAMQIIEPLWKRYPETEDAVRGDILYLMGEAGGSDRIPEIESAVAGTTNPELLEASRDAVARIREKEAQAR
jgi:hypothetical protein